MTAGVAKKVIHTMRRFRGTAYYYYGDHWSSLFKFLYYSLLASNEFVVCGADLGRDVPVYELGKGFSVLKPTQEQLDDLRRGRDLPIEFYYDRIHGVKKCYVLTYEGELVYISWVYFEGDPSRFLRLREGVAEVNYNTTMPKFRGQGLMGKMLAIICRDLKEEGCKWVMIVIHAKNLPALKSAQKAGFSEMARIRTLGHFNRKFKA